MQSPGRLKCAGGGILSARIARPRQNFLPGRTASVPDCYSLPGRFSHFRPTPSDYLPIPSGLCCPAPPRTGFVEGLFGSGPSRPFSALPLTVLRTSSGPPPRRNGAWCLVVEWPNQTFGRSFRFVPFGTKLQKDPVGVVEECHQTGAASLLPSPPAMNQKLDVIVFFRADPLEASLFVRRSQLIHFVRVPRSK